MFITLRNSSTSYPLAGEYGVSERVHSPAAGFRKTPAIALQEAERVRAAAAAYYDRQNLRTAISFTTTRRFASPAAAQIWCLDYDADFPRTGDVWLDALATDGVTRTRRVLASAVVEPPDCETIGATVRLAYVIRGGAITEWSGDTPGDLAVTGSLTSDGSTPVTFGTLLPAAWVGGKIVWTDNGLTSGQTRQCYWDTEDSRWKLIALIPASPIWSSASDTVDPASATGWAPHGATAATGTPILTLNP